MSNDDVRKPEKDGHVIKSEPCDNVNPSNDDDSKSVMTEAGKCNDDASGKTRDDDDVSRFALTCSLVRAECESLRERKEGLKERIAKAEAERDSLLTSVEKDLNLKAEIAEVVKKAFECSERRIGENERLVGEMERERERLRREIDDFEILKGESETVSELHTMLSTLERELSLLQSHLETHRRMKERAGTLRDENERMEEQLRKDDEFIRINESLIDLVQRKEETKKRISALKSCEKELFLTIQMHERGRHETRSLEQIRLDAQQAREQARQKAADLLRLPVTTELQEAKERKERAKREREKKEEELDIAREKTLEQKRVVLELKNLLEHQTKESDAFVSQIEAIGQSYEEMRSQNKRLLVLIQQRDAVNTQLMSESVRAQQLSLSLSAEREVFRKRRDIVLGGEGNARARLAKAEESALSVLNQIFEVQKSNLETRQRVESLKNKKRTIQREVQAHKAEVERTKNKMQDMGVVAAQMREEIEKEKLLSLSLEEENSALYQKLMKMTAGSTGSAEKEKGDIEKLEMEVREYKSILTCSICEQRMKEVVIAKCFHLFCAECIQRNLEIRQRKCPACNVPFGQNDVKNVYI